MSTHQKEKRVYTGQEIAEALQVSPLTVWRLWRNGLLKQVTGLRNRYSAASFHAMLAGEKEAKK